MENGKILLDILRQDRDFADKTLQGKRMRYFRKIIWPVLAFDLLLLAFVVVSFRVDNMTLAKGTVYSFNENWVIRREDGSTRQRRKFCGYTVPHVRGQNTDRDGFALLQFCGLYHGDDGRRAGYSDSGSADA